MVEKIALAIDNRFHDPIDRLSAMFDVAQQVDGRAHFVLNEVPRFFRDALRKHLLIARANAQARTAVIGKVNYVVAVFIELFNVNLGRYQNWLFRRVATAGIWIKGTNELQFRGQSLDVDTGLFREMWQLVLLQAFQMLTDQFCG